MINLKKNHPSKEHSFYPWIVIGFCALFLFYKYVLQISPSVMTTELMRTFHVDGAGLGNLAATYFYAYLIMQLFAGALLDRYSPKYLTVGAILLCVLGAFSFAHTQFLFHAELSRALMGLGTAFATVSYMKMSSLWFHKNQVALVDGLLATAAMAGALFAQVPLSLLISHTNWRFSLDVCGIFGLALALLFLVFVKEKKSIGGNENTVRLKELLPLLYSRKNWLLLFYSGLAFTPLAVLGGLWGNPFFEVAHHLTSTKAASFCSFMFLGLAVGAPSFGFLSDYFSNRINSMLLGTSIAFITLIPVIYVTTLPLWLLGSLLFLFGFGTGSFMSCYSFGKELNSIRFAASVVALINTGDALFGSFTEPAIGKILDLFWNGKMAQGAPVFSAGNFHIALTVLPIYMFFALACLLLLKRKE